MRHIAFTPIVASFVTSILLFHASAPRASAQAGNNANEVITNESVIQMIVGKLPKDLIVTKVRSTKSNFDITPAGLITLNLNKVPADIIKTMMLTTATNTKDASRETINNEAVIKMVIATLPRDLIITKIQTSRPDYDLSTNGLISLNQNKVSTDIIKAMQAAHAGTTTAPATTTTPPPARGRTGRGAIPPA